MKGLVAVFLLLSVAEGRHYWRHWGPPQETNYHLGETFKQFQENGNLNSADVGKTEWVCRHPASEHVLIILGINWPLPQTGQNPSEVPNSNGNDHHGSPNDGNLNSGEHNHNVNITPQSDTNESSLSHGGEGLIDVRLGP